MPQRIMAVFAITVAACLSVLDLSMLNVALPYIGAELGVPHTLAVWVINAYQLSIAMTLLTLSAVGDRLGREVVFRAGLVVFLLGSIGSALAPDIGTLLTARVVQGLGSAAVMSGAAALLRASYPARLLAFGLGLNTMAATSAAAMGPSLGAALITWLGDWRVLFMIGLPFGLLAVPFTWALPKVPRQFGAISLTSSGLNALCMGCAILGLALLTRHLALALLLLAGAALLLYLWVMHDRHQVRPLLPVDLFKLAPFNYGIVTSTLMFAGQAMALLATSFYLQINLGFSVVQTGLYLTCWPLSLVATTTLAVRLNRRYDTAVLCALGGACLAAGLAWVLLGGKAYGVFGLLLGGVAIGLFQAPNLKELIASSPANRSAAVGSMQALSRIGGAMLGVSIAGGCLALSASQGAVYALYAGIVVGLLVLVVNLQRRSTHLIAAR